MVGASTDGAIAAAACGLSRGSRHGSCDRGESCCNNGNAIAGDAAVDAPTDYGNICRPGFANYTAVDGSKSNCHAGCNRPLGGFPIRVWLCHRAATATGEAAAGNAAGPCQRDR